MGFSLRRLLSFLLTIILISQISHLTAKADNGFIVIKEGKIEEKQLKEDFIYESFVEPQYILEQIKYEDKLYEYQIPEQLLCQTILYEIKISPDTITNLAEMIPPQLHDYDIDWAGVIAKFAIGTTIIIAVGVVNWLTKGGSTFFIMATPGTVAKDAFIGGAIGTVANIGLREIMSNGTLPDRALYKYAIEGFAEGYMWGAIASVLKVAAKNFKRLTMFKKANGGTLKIKLNGDVLDQSGKYIGKAYYDSSKVWHLVNEAANTTTIFDSAGREVMSSAGTALPPNQVLRMGTSDTFTACYTDAAGQIYRVDNALKPDITYQLGEYIYQTDSKGRIAKVTFDHLVLKPEGQPRRIIVDTMKTIGRNNAKLNDQRGHLIADLFCGDNTMANIVPQAPKANQMRIKEIETLWADAVRKGNNVSGTIQISYSGNSFRPAHFTYSYNSGSGWIEQTIPNK